MVARMYYDADTDPEVLNGSRIAVLGYGSQGHAHALNLRDSGYDVRVGLPETSRSRAAAEAEGLRVMTPAEAVAEANVIMVLAPKGVWGLVSRRFDLRLFAVQRKIAGVGNPIIAEQMRTI